VVWSLLALPVCAYTIPDYELRQVEQEYGYGARAKLEELIGLMNDLESADEKTKIIYVNRFFNNIPYLSDMRNWGVSDYWALRDEMFGKNAGDCEDYAIAKYFTLKQLGVSIDKMYITYAKSLTYNSAHMVLSYFRYPDSVPYILCNYVKKILPASKRTDLIPLYSFNGESLYLAKQVGLGREMPSEFLKNRKWINLLNRIER
jgi:predicted transglutaminase-like cysteine proteinase